MKRFTYIFILMFSLFTTSCIKEDLDECNVTARLLFSYYGDGETEIFSDKIEKVNLYVYNQSSELVDKKEIDKAALRSFQGTYLHLLPGDYRIVCWGNAMDRTSIQSSNLSGMVVTHFDNSTESGCKHSIDSLYYGTYNLNVPKTDKLIKDTLIQDIIPFQGAHIKFRVAVKGLENVMSRSLFDKVRLSLDNLPLRYNCERVISSDNCDYSLLPTETYSGSDMMFSAFNSMRFPNNNNVNLRLVNASNNEVLHTLSIKDFLVNENIDVEKYHEVMVPILIEFKSDPGSSVGVTVIVKAWNGIDITPEI